MHFLSAIQMSSVCSMLVVQPGHRHAADCVRLVLLVEEIRDVGE